MKRGPDNKYPYVVFIPDDSTQPREVFRAGPKTDIAVSGDGVEIRHESGKKVVLPRSQTCTYPGRVKDIQYEAPQKPTPIRDALNRVFRVSSLKPHKS